MTQMQIGAIDTIRLPRDAGRRVRTAADELARWIGKIGCEEANHWDRGGGCHSVVKHKRDRPGAGALS